MNYTDTIKHRLKENAIGLCEQNSELKGQEHKTALIWENLEMNFNKKSFGCIQKNEEWFKRTQKTHQNVPDVLEMQSSNSSDALLMNIFCYPKIFDWKGVRDLLEISLPIDMILGWNPNCFENEHPKFPTEVDLKINDTIFEAKLTEKDFQSKDKKTVAKYPDFTSVFHTNLLPQTDNKYTTYQLIRNFLIAHFENFNFVLLVDSSRIDLIRGFYDTAKAIKCPELRKRIRFITWQELVGVCGEDLKEYITEKYF